MKVAHHRYTIPPQASGHGPRTPHYFPLRLQGPVLPQARPYCISPQRRRTSIRRLPPRSTDHSRRRKMEPTPRPLTALHEPFIPGESKTNRSQWTRGSKTTESDRYVLSDPVSIVMTASLCCLVEDHHVRATFDIKTGEN